MSIGNGFVFDYVCQNRGSCTEPSHWTATDCNAINDDSNDAAEARYDILRGGRVCVCVCVCVFYMSVMICNCVCAVAGYMYVGFSK